MAIAFKKILECESSRRVHSFSDEIALAIQSHLKVLGRCYGEKNICNRFARMFMAEGEEELACNAGKMIQMAEERHDQQV